MSHSLRDNVKSQFVEGVEYTPWGPFIEAMLNGGSMQDSEVKRLYEEASRRGLYPLRPLEHPKWPITHIERIEYLRGVRDNPSVKHNSGNIDAAISWHETFPQNELCSSELVYFQGGDKVDEWDWKQPSFWAEGMAIAFMNNPPAEAQPAVPPFAQPLLPGAQNVNGLVGEAVFGKRNFTMFQVDVEMRCPALANGNDIIYLTNMSYDTGCSSIAIHPNEIASFVPPGTLLNRMTVRTASGPQNAHLVTLQVRVLDAAHTGILRDWTAMNALVLNSGERIGSAPLRGLFVCQHRDGQRLYCATNKTRLVQFMPS